ncbi:hypothetical protein [Microbulbifer sp.]|uniref:hypothetical protein n=1 Tax=Microbulbifer sp. TaxID=1908541 RepID=UPI00258F60B7|nr:hypothetical protein [Microbulbifer sp.]
MRIFQRRSVAVAAGVLCLSLQPLSALAQGFWGGDESAPSLNIAATEITLDIPVSISTTNLQLLLAQASNGGGLSEIKQQAVRKYTQHLHSELARELEAHFDDEDIPLVQDDGILELGNSLDIKVIKHLVRMQSKGGYDIEEGVVVIAGEFRYQLSNRAGNNLREHHIDVDELEISSKYRIRTRRNSGDSDDNTGEAIERALSALVEELMDAMEDNLEADQLRAMAEL